MKRFLWLGLAIEVLLLAAVSGCSSKGAPAPAKSSMASPSAAGELQAEKDLQAYKKVPAETLLSADRGHFILYYVDKDSGRAVKYDATGDDLQFDREDHRGQFPCILENGFYHLFPATCWSQSGKYTYKSMDIATKSSFDERISRVEVDTAKLLDIGRNDYLVNTYWPYADYDFGAASLRLQKLGSDNLFAACGGGQENADQEPGDVDLFETSDRPMARVHLAYTHHETDWDVNYLGRTQLKRGNRTYRCDGVVTVGPDRLIIQSGKTLVIVDLKSKQMATLDLPAEPLNGILYRLVAAQ